MSLRFQFCILDLSLPQICSSRAPRVAAHGTSSLHVTSSSHDVLPLISSPGSLPRSEVSQTWPLQYFFSLQFVRCSLQMWHVRRRGTAVDEDRSAQSSDSTWEASKHRSEQLKPDSPDRCIS
jgi:hypothetical protein